MHQRSDGRCSPPMASDGPPLSARDVVRQRSAPGGLLLQRPFEVRQCTVRMLVCVCVCVCVRACVAYACFWVERVGSRSFAVLSTCRHHARTSVCFAGEQTRQRARQMMQQLPTALASRLECRTLSMRSSVHLLPRQPSRSTDRPFERANSRRRRETMTSSSLSTSRVRRRCCHHRVDR
jgi:hypothetical protein